MSRQAATAFVVLLWLCSALHVQAEEAAHVPSIVHAPSVIPAPSAPQPLEQEETASVMPLDPPSVETSQIIVLDVPLPDEIPLADELVAKSLPAPVSELAVREAIAPAPQEVVPDAASAPPAQIVSASSLVPISLGLDDAGIRAALEPMRLAFRLTPAKVEGIVQAYASNKYQTFWVERAGHDIRQVQGVDGVLASLASAERDGLDPVRLHRALPARIGGTIPSEKAVSFDLAISLAAYLYAHDARGGRLEPSRPSALITPHLHLPDAEGLLIRLAGQDAARVEAILTGYQPKHAGYLALRQQLNRLRSSDALSGDHITKVALSGKGSASARQDEQINELLVNMERWRWLPPDLGENYIFVNVPDYRLSMVSSGNVVHQTRVIVGKPETPTPIFSDAMEHLIINPSWHVPPSILRKEFLPNLAKDPGYAARKGFEVLRRGNSISVRQPPGERNALGQIKFIFPNNHAVYLHDTPGRHLFAQENRTFSHGCVRVEAPFALAERILASQGGESQAALRAMVGKGERMIKINGTLPVHLAYFTLSVDENGTLKRQKDIYGHDERVRQALQQGSNVPVTTAFLP
jgi:L,D-transpeptidase YcbB